MPNKAKQERQPKAPTASFRESGQASPATILALALAGSIGYFAWKLWKKRQAEAGGDHGSTSAGASASVAASSGKAKGSSFTFDRPGKGGAGASGRSAEPSSRGGPVHSRSRNEPRPKTQKQLRKEAKEAKKAARAQAANDAEGAQVAAAIARRAKEAGLGQQQQQPEPQKQHYVDYDSVAKGYDKIVEWQATGKKTF